MRNFASSHGTSLFSLRCLQSSKAQLQCYNEGDLMNHLLSFVDQTMDSHPGTVVVCGGDLNQTV